MKILDIIILSLGATFIFSVLIYLIYGKITEYKFDLIAEKFQKKFGYIPFSMSVGKRGGVLFWGYKESYLTCALLFPKFPGAKKTLTEEEILFFKSLKFSEVSWFYIKYTMVIVGLLSLLSLSIIFKIADV